MINSIDSVISYDWGLYNIICDEIDSYYIQGKSEDEIAKTLQSRIDLYVAENYKRIIMIKQRKPSVLIAIKEPAYLNKIGKNYYQLL